MNTLTYLDESAVNEVLITHHGGKLKETIERISSNTNIGGEIGGEVGDPSGLLARLKASISTSWEKGEEKEFVYDLRDEVAKFTLLSEVLEASGATQVDEEFSIQDRDMLTTDSPIMIAAPLIRTPIEELKNKFDMEENLGGISEAIDHFAKSGMFDQNEVEELQDEIESADHASKGMTKFFDSFMDHDDLYRTNTASEVDFVMELPEQNFRTPPIGFPSPTEPYVILAKITRKIKQGNDVQLIPFAEFAEKKTDNPREQTVEERRIKGEMRDMANDMIDERHISSSEFGLSYPNLQVQPLAIY